MNLWPDNKEIKTWKWITKLKKLEWPWVSRNKMLVKLVEADNRRKFDLASQEERFEKEKDVIGKLLYQYLDKVTTIGLQRDKSTMKLFRMYVAFPDILFYDLEKGYNQEPVIEYFERYFASRARRELLHLLATGYTVMEDEEIEKYGRVLG